MLGRPGAGGGDDFEASQGDYESNFVLGPDETLAGALDAYAVVAAETEAAVAGIDDLGQAVPVPKGVPWYPDDVEAWSVRWVPVPPDPGDRPACRTSPFVEAWSVRWVVPPDPGAAARRHADIVRESIDGATMYPLMAAVEGWPASPWMQPWEPAAG